MKEFRKANILFNKTGRGATTTRLTIPVGWIKEMGFNDEDRQAIIEIDNDKIIIRKVGREMILIKNRNVEYVSSYADFELEDGTLLFDQDWNGEIYRNGWKNEKNTNCEYKPVYKFEIDNINLDDLEENSDEWNSANEIVGFEVL